MKIASSWFRIMFFLPAVSIGMGGISNALAQSLGDFEEIERMESGTSISGGADTVNQSTLEQVARDSVVWGTDDINNTGTRFPARYLEHVGERYGLGGPIIANGGSGSNAWVVVYDVSGVLVGKMSRSEAEADPKKLLELIQVAAAQSYLRNVIAVGEIEDLHDEPF